MPNKKYKTTDEEFAQVVRNNFSVRSCLNALGIIPAGGNYKIFHARVERLKLDTSHFTGKGHLKGKSHNWSNKREMEGDILAEGSNYQSHKLKIRLIGEGYKEHVCENCGLTEWMGEKISLELDHINGINTDNRLDNLRLLCPNCHSLTDTYRGRNKRNK